MIVNGQENARKILGVSNKADEQEIKRSYRTLVKLFHPDLVEGAEDQFRELTEAYNLLLPNSQQTKKPVKTFNFQDRFKEQAQGLAKKNKQKREKEKEKELILNERLKAQKTEKNFYRSSLNLKEIQQLFLYKAEGSVEEAKNFLVQTMHITTTDDLEKIINNKRIFHDIKQLGTEKPSLMTLRARQKLDQVVDNLNQKDLGIENTKKNLAKISFLWSVEKPVAPDYVVDFLEVVQDQIYEFNLFSSITCDIILLPINAGEDPEYFLQQYHSLYQTLRDREGYSISDDCKVLQLANLAGRRYSQKRTITRAKYASKEVTTLLQIPLTLGYLSQIREGLAKQDLSHEDIVEAYSLIRHTFARKFKDVSNEDFVNQIIKYNFRKHFDKQ